MSQDIQRRVECLGVDRDKDCISALRVYFSRRVTDQEMQFLREVMQRTAMVMPLDLRQEPRPPIIWRCRCGWMMPDVEYQAAKFQPKCPRCPSGKGELIRQEPQS